jgi:hypothetical protein
VRPGARAAGRVAASDVRQPAASARLRRVPISGTVFAQVTVVPVLLVMAWLIPGVVLLSVGWLRPAPLVLIAAPLAVLMVTAVARRLPGQRPAGALRAAPAPGRARGWAAWWGLGGTLAVAAGFGAWQAALNSPQIIVLRDPGAQFQLGYWLAGHGALPIPRALADFGGPHPGLDFASTGFVSTHTGLLPLFMPGLAIISAGGWWAHGMTAAALASPVLGALAVLTVGGLAGRLAGPQWAPAAALALALSLPEQYTSRAAFAEPLIQVLLFGGLSLAVDSLASQPGHGWAGRYPGRLRWPGWLPPVSAAALLGGLAIGLTSVVSLGTLPYLIPLIPFLGAAVVGRLPCVVPLGLGILAGVGCGLTAGRLAAPAYLAAPGFSVRPASVITAGAALVTLLAVLAVLWEPAQVRARRLLRGAARWGVPELAGVLVAAALAVLVIRPSVQTAHWAPGPGTVRYVGSLQKLLGLPVQPTRSYAEDTMYWVIWYIGIPALLLGGIGAALLTRRCVRALLRWRDPDGTARAWALPLAVLGWAAAIALWAPGTVPDQPWASRVLVPAATPAFLLGGVWVAARLDARARERGAGLPAVGLAAACFAAALAIPTAVTTLGVGFSGSNVTGSTPGGSSRGVSGGARHGAEVTLSGLGVHRTGAGQADAVQGLCGTMSSQMSVLVLDATAAGQFAQLIRGMCHVPVGVMAGASPAEVRAVVQAVVAHGRQPVLLATQARDLGPYSAGARRVLGLVTNQDPHELTQPPTSPWPVSYSLWMVPGSGVPGA